MGLKGILAISAGLCTVGGVATGCYYGFNNTNKETKDTQESTNLETKNVQNAPEAQDSGAESPTSGGTVEETRASDTLSSAVSGTEQVPAAPQAPSIGSPQTGRTQDTTAHIT